LVSRIYLVSPGKFQIVSHLIPLHPDPRLIILNIATLLKSEHYVDPLNDEGITK